MCDLCLVLRAKPRHDYISTASVCSRWTADGASVGRVPLIEFLGHHQSARAPHTTPALGCNLRHGRCAVSLPGPAASLSVAFAPSPMQWVRRRLRLRPAVVVPCVYLVAAATGKTELGARSGIQGPANVRGARLKRAVPGEGHAVCMCELEGCARNEMSGPAGRQGNYMLTRGRVKHWDGF
jgi:hypothetical protein